MSNRETILVTGGAGFVGSHFARMAADTGRNVVVLDDLSAGPPAALPSSISVIVGDIGERHFVTHLLRERRIAAVVHFAGKIDGYASMADPAGYYEVNVVRTLQLLLAIRDAGVNMCLFSSAAAVYGNPERVPISEIARREPTKPFGATKLAVELALDGWLAAYGVRWAALRHFTVAGAHPDGTLRENHEPETHLIPRALDAGVGSAPQLRVFGDNYDTPDGTCIRDFIHVQDVASAYMAALARLESGASLGAMNIGTGRGYSVRDVIEAGSIALRRRIPYAIAPRRIGDSPKLLSDPTRAMTMLGWRPVRSDLPTIIDDTLRSRYSGSLVQSRSA
jgi:UDP-glucose-4-epimerase GalE